MDIKKGLAGLFAILVAGVIIAGQTLGWSTFLPRFSSAHISISPTSRPPSESFFSNEKLWVTLSKTETDHVYWVFDESNNVILGGVQLQYTFPFDEKLPEGIESKKRIDAFYKDGDDYRHVATRVTVRNLQIKSNAAFGESAFAFTLPKSLPGNWTLGTVQLSKLYDGKFHDITAKPVSLITTDSDTRIVWDGSKVATEFGYSSLKEAGIKLLTNDTAWVTAEYKGQNKGEVLTVVKPVSKFEKP